MSVAYQQRSRSSTAINHLLPGSATQHYLSLAVSIAKKLHSLFLPLRKRDPMSKTSEAVVFRARVPFTLFDIDTYASKYGRSEV